MEKTSNKNDQDIQLFILTELLNIQDRVRGISVEELRFVSANETFNIIEYDTAVLWEYDENGKAKITALSGVPEVDKQNEYTQFLKRLHKAEFSDIAEACEYDPSKCRDERIKKEWKSHLPKNAYLIPLKSTNKKNAALLLARKQQFKNYEKAVAEKLSTIYGHEFSLRHSKRSPSIIIKMLQAKPMRALLLLATITALLWPVRTSTLAPAEIIAKAPDLIRAPLDGIVKNIHVQPNNIVKQGDMLITLDDAALIAQEDVSQNALAAAQAQLRQVSQEALSSTEARSKLSALKAQVEKEQANLEYYKEMRQRAAIKAPKNGTVIFEDTFDWLGRPVKIGERIMLLADPQNTQLEIRLPIENAINVPSNAKILFFSNASPDRPTQANLSFHSYRASQTEEGALAYRLKAAWEEQESAQLVRLGMKGTAKIYGERQPLLIQILRVPLLKIRQWSGI